VVANVSRLNALFDLKPRHDSLEEILRSTLAWRTREMTSAATPAPAVAAAGATQHRPDQPVVRPRYDAHGEGGRHSYP
jgi:hypothetical protein